MARQHQVSSDGVLLNVIEEGAGRPVLLAHGMWCHSGMFAPIAADLASDYRVVSVDFRGHGESGLSPRGWSIEDAADDLKRAMQALGITAAAVVGYSMGGMAAQHLALRHPDNVRAVVLIGTSAAAESLDRRLQIRSILFFMGMLGTKGLIPHQAARFLFTPLFRKSAPDVVDQWCAHVDAMDKRAMIQALEVMANRPSVIGRLGQIDVPVSILVGGEDDIASPQNAKQLAQGLPDAHLNIIPKVGHGLPMEQPLEMARLIRAFLKKIHY